MARAGTTRLSPKGMGLLAHELTHVGQQQGAQWTGSGSGMAALESAAQEVGRIVEMTTPIVGVAIESVQVKL